MAKFDLKDSLKSVFDQHVSAPFSVKVCLQSDESSLTYQRWLSTRMGHKPDFMISVWRNLYINKATLLAIAIRDFKAKYIGSYIGILWAIVNPLSQVMIYTLVFSVILKLRPGPKYEGIGFTLWLMSGMLPWLFFSESITLTTHSLTDNQQMITKTTFPAEVLPVARLVTALFSHFVFFIIIVGFLIFMNMDILLMNKVYLFLPLIPVYTLLMAFFSAGLGLFLSAVNVYVRDVSPLMTLILNIWFFYTPVMYPADVIPSYLQGIAWLNPMFHFVDWYRSALLAGQLPTLVSILYVIGVSMSVFVIGTLVFKKLKSGFADLL